MGPLSNFVGIRHDIYEQKGKLFDSEFCGRGSVFSHIFSIQGRHSGSCSMELSTRIKVVNWGYKTWKMFSQCFITVNHSVLVPDRSR